MAIHFDTQGPAPDGFHVPTNDELNSLVNTVSGIGLSVSNGNNIRTYLKMPYAGFRNYSNHNIEYQGEFGFYRSCIQDGDGKAKGLKYSASSLTMGNSSVRGHGFSIRPFKDEVVNPIDSGTTLKTGWTWLYQTGVKGIAHNSTDGLISLSSNGTTWITIADKNLGATTVYNNGNTLSEANCGHYYQWGNNYGFAWTGDVITSTTQVDASDYGPGNYYNNDTFIYESNDWSSIRNDNLWGGVSQGTRSDPIYKLHGHIGTWHMESVKDYSAMQGPAPDGFHVPTTNEWATLCGILTTTFSLASNSSTMKIYLKLPDAGCRYYESAEADYKGSIGNYWASTCMGNFAYELRFNSSNLMPQNGDYHTFGNSVRCFKDKPVTPDNSWTQLYDGGDGPQGELTGIYHNATLGLISISSDGTNRTTIQDKNLGATTVYNSGDTLSEANCGKYYQRGNNYGFPRTGSVTTSSTQVDASTYGPGNYYSSSTFITRSSSPYRWDSTDNGNLWGGVTGVVTRYIPRS